MSYYRTRKDEDANYFSIFVNGRTLRFFIRDDEPMTAPEYPELYDISINNKCYGNCSYCYASALSSGHNYEDIVRKAYDFFGPLGNNRPYSCAIGGAGEPTLHPDFIPFMEALKDMGIMPNYTTNGMHITNDIVRCAVETCGGVALSAHDHLERYWTSALTQYVNAGARTNIHVVVGDVDSVAKTKRLYETYADSIDYMVLLPYIPQGRAKRIETQGMFDALFNWLGTLEDMSKFAFGAYFFSELERRKIPAYIYEPHMFSRYLDMDAMTVFESSFHGTQGV